MIRYYGIRGHDLSASSTQEILDQLDRLSLDGVQLAPAKVYDALKSPGDFLTGHFARAVAEAFQRRDKKVLVLGCYLNHAHPDPALQKEFQRITAGYIKACADHDFACVATESFTLHGDGSPHPEDHTEAGYQRLVRQLEPLVEVAEILGVDFVVEGAAHHILHDIATLKRLVEDIDSPRLKLIFDPVNLMTETLAKDQEGFFQDYLETLGAHIQAVHLKDFRFHGSEKKVLTAGEGELAYAKLFPLLQALPHPVDLLLEGVEPPLLETAVRFMKSGGLG